MSGPIVRTGATPEFWENWDKVFGDKAQKGTKKASGKKKSTARGKAKKATKKSSKKK
tara:strand:+ start:1409 stop:1579 length:171 start_codon:yes stop_codon:yes gene_type:complete